MLGQIITLFVALSLSLVAIIHIIVDTSGAIGNAINGSKSWQINSKPTLVLGIIAIANWCLFYYLTH